MVAVLPVKVLYPAQGKQWLGYFLQDELSRQFQLQKHFTALSPGEVNRWFQDEDAEEKQLQSFQKSVKPHWILELEEDPSPGKAGRFGETGPGASFSGKKGK